MQLIINDQSRQYSPGLNITDLIQGEGLGDQLCAVAVNGVFVPKGKHDQTTLVDGDRVEIVSPREGG